MRVVPILDSVSIEVLPATADRFDDLATDAIAGSCVWTSPSPSSRATRRFRKWFGG